MGEIDEIATALGISKDFIVKLDNKILISKFPHEYNKKITRKLNIPTCNFGICQKYNIVFMGCVFESEIYDGHSNGTEYNEVCFKQCKFFKKFDLSCHNITIHNQFIMQDCTFEKEVAINANFKCNVYFNNSTFHDYADFHECKFEKVACFYGATFEKVPNFSQAIFKGNLNLVNTNLNFYFEDVEKKIKEEYSNHIGTEKEKFLDKFANDFRDSFRLFKNALIKENNLLDAANHHRIELYCKEIELESKKPKIFSKDWIDKWILKFYRHTSDHHTDLLKIWHSLLIVVGIFGILSSGVIVAFDYGYLKFCDFSAHSLIEMYNAHINHFVLTHSYQMLGMNALLFMLFIGLFILSVLWDRARVIGICISYCVMIFLFAASPKYLIPAIGIFTDKRSMLDPLSVIGGIYTIVFAFMLYSFIKTARKNSIIPH